MTIWESTDNIENVTITSDEAFERVTSDEHFEEEKDWGFLKQNTSWLVQEIPNISFLDIADTMLESNKTLYDRENWILRVWKAGRSVEAQPQDTILLRLDDDQSFWPYSDTRIQFDSDASSLNYTTCKPDNTYIFNWYKVKILQTWYYTISYWWVLNPGTSEIARISIESNSTRITYDYFKDTTLPETISWWKTIRNIKLNEWDIVWMKIYLSDGWTLLKDTYMTVQFQQYIL